MWENTRRNFINLEYYSKLYAKWFGIFDKKCFDDFFSDKHIFLFFPEHDREFNFEDRNCPVAFAEPWNNLIGINPHTLKVATIEEQKDTLLHEMLHMWIYYCHPRGRVAYKEKSRAFREWSRLLECPMYGRRVSESKNVRFWVCGNCGAWSDKEKDYHYIICPYCGSTFTKQYASKRCGRHL
jgi:DNA-directed RNA polymerase subunit RPC12/RpoP